MSGEKPFLSTAENAIEIAKEQTAPREVYLDLLKQFHECADASREKNQEDIEKPDATLFLDLENTTNDALLLQKVHNYFQDGSFGVGHHASRSSRVIEMYNLSSTEQVGKLSDGARLGTFVLTEIVEAEKPEESYQIALPSTVTIAFSDGNSSTPNNEFLVKQYYIDSEGNITYIAD